MRALLLSAAHDVSQMMPSTQKRLSWIFLRCL